MKDLAADRVDLTLNGAPVTCAPLAGERLSASLRERLGAREVKVGCNAGDCGACTVLLDGAAVCACLVATHQAAGAVVETAAGLAGDPLGARLMAAFLAAGAVQCGICTPGMVAAGVALLRAVPQPSEQQVRDALGGVLCRCTGYGRIVAAVMGAGAAVADGAVGQPVARVDGGPKVTGAERFGDDVAPVGALVVRVVRSPHAHARFTFSDLAGWADGLTVLTAADVPGLNAFGVIPGFIDQPVFAQAYVRFRGEAVAAVVGEADRMAALDLSGFPVVWEPLPPLTSPDAALTGPALHPDRGGNVMCRGRVARGDPEAGLAAAAVTAELTIQTTFVEHAYIEPEAGFAEMVGDRLHVHACTQAPGMDREGLATILGWPMDRIRIVPTAVGGGFGAKLDLSVQPFLALAAIRTGRPCRIAYSRTESMQSTTKRHPAQITVRAGADRDGRLTGMTFDGTFNTGAYASWGPTVANRVPVHGSGPYLVPHYRAQTQAIYTHNPPAGAFRGFGVPQAAIAQEQVWDLLADRLGMDRLAFRRLNALRDGQPTVCGQVFDSGVGIGACLDALQGGWDRERAAAVRANALGGPVRVGVGVASGWYGCGNTSLPNPSTIRAGVMADGRIVLHQGAVDIGQGSNTVIAQIFAENLGVPLSAVALVGADTDITPDAGKTSASRQTFVTGNAALRAAGALRAALARLTNAAPDAPLTLDGDRLTAMGGQPLHLTGAPYAVEVTESYDPPTRPLDADGQGAPYAQFGYAAHLAVVAVDRELATVKVLRMVAAHDVGRAINPLMVQGQVEGGIAQGLGMALMEDYIPGRTENLHDYLIPTIGDVPQVETVIVEVPDPHGPFGAKGLGEHVLIPTAPAILNAIRDATGVTVTQLPATPARLAALIRGQHG